MCGPHPDTMKLILRNAVLAWSLGCGAALAVPYTGGSGSGFAAGRLANFRMDGSPDWPQPHPGGSCDGFAVFRISNHKLGATDPPGSDLRFLAGPGDGFASGRLANQLLGPSPNEEWDALAMGGSGDGFSSVVANNLSVTPPPPDDPYLAGSAGGDGFGGFRLANHPLGPPQGFEPLILSAGGVGDGFHAARLANGTFGTPLEPDELIFAFSGPGGGDGFDAGRLTSFDLGSAALPVVQFVGGMGDGFSAAGLANMALNGQVVSVVAFLGGSADGFDASRVSNQSFEFYFGSPAGYGTYQTALFSSVEIASGIADPNRDADGDGVANLIEFALGSDPKNGAGSPGIAPTLLSPAEFGLPDDGESYLTLDIPRSPNALGVSVGVEFSSTLGVETWDSESCVPLINIPTRLVVRDCEPVESQPSRFARVTATLSP